jgi:imidazolonepropionase-like amidohydrolase
VEELRPMVDAVHGRGKKVAAHSSGGGARNAALAGCDTIEHGWRVDRAAAEAMLPGTALVTTLSVLASFRTFAATVGLNWSAITWDLQLESASAAVRAAREAGVRIAAGSDFGGGSVRAGHLAWEVELLVLAGLTPLEALAAATWVGGQVLGVPNAGTLNVGGAADLFLVHGDPLSEPGALWRVWMVFREGERVA